MNVNLIVSLILMGFVVTGRSQSGGAFNLNWDTIDSGGGTSVGGDYSVGGTIGQPDGGAMNGGSFQLSGGFWPVTRSRERTPQLRILLASPFTPPNINARVTLAWPFPSPSYQLEAASSPAEPAWAVVANAPSVVDGEYRVTLEATGVARMFRLRSP